MAQPPPTWEPIAPTSRAGHLVVRAGLVAWSIIGIALVGWGIWQIAAWLRVLFIALGLAVLIVLILEPAVSALERRRVPRWAAAIIVYLSLLTPLSIGLWVIGHAAFNQLGNLVEDAPRLARELDLVAERAWERLLQAGVPLPAEDLETWVRDNRDEIVRWILAFVTAATRLGGLVLASLVGPIVAFYILAELPRIRRSAFNLMPPERGEQVREGLRIVGGTVGAFFRGQLMIAVIVGGLSTAGLYLLGVPYFVLIGAIAGITNLVPFLGPIVGSVPGIALGWAEGGPLLGLKVLVLFVVVQQLESHLFSPLILGATVRLRPVAVVIGMIVGAAIAGLLGMILAVPAIASVKSLWEKYGPRASEPEPAV